MTNYLDSIKNDKFEVRLTKNNEELVLAQKLRYKIFFEEDGAIPSEQVKKEKRDFDEFDPYCDHLIVVNKKVDVNSDDYIIGTYRLMKKDGAKALGKWYSDTEFNVSKFNNYDGEVLELGRACVKKEYRSKLIMTMLWNGLAAYMFDYNIKLMFGCGSFLGTDVNQYRQSLSYLYYNDCIATGDMEVEAISKDKCEYPIISESEFNSIAAFQELPTMIKGYLRIGCKVSRSIYIDWNFNCFDICIIFETKNLKKSYLDHYRKIISNA